MAVFTQVNKNKPLEYITCDEMLFAVKAVMGEIDLDPFSSDLANEFVEAKKYYTIQDDSMNPQEPWTGNVYVFPPNNTYYYSQKAGRYIMKNAYSPTMVGGANLAFKILYKFYCQGHVNQAIYTTNTLDMISTQQKMFRFPLSITRGRGYVYLNDGDELRHHTTGPLITVYFPPKDNIEESIERFMDTYKCFGHVQYIADRQY